LHLGIGYRAEDVKRELAALAARVPVDLTYNPDFHAGNIVTLHTLRAALTAGDDVLLMDADVLYHREILARLVASHHGNCFLLDRDFEPGVEPVKLCVSGGRLVEFGKQIPAGVPFDLLGESVGFFKLTAAMAARLAERASRYVGAGCRDAFYEDALRDLLLEDPGAFGFEDVTGIPWIEIDFQDDIRRAETEVLVHINACEAA